MCVRALACKARRCEVEFGDEFFPRYQALLRDTGRMTAEALAEKHLEVDLTQPDFWCDTLEALKPRVDTFADVMAEAGFSR